MNKDEQMEVKIFKNKSLSGEAAAVHGAEHIRNAIEQRDEANIVIATGASQFEMMRCLVKADGIDWGKVTMFHLDEYADLPEEHPASFRKYIKERFVSKLPTKLKAAHFINGNEDDACATCQKLSELIKQCQIDVAFIGIGENGHIAFNDPPADFNTEEPFIIVELDEACRKQQLGEGWFDSLEDVPQRAISMSVKQIMKSKVIVNTVPDKRKAEAVKNAIEGEITNKCPASILREHPNCTTYLDEESASLLTI